MYRIILAVMLLVGCAAKTQPQIERVIAGEVLIGPDAKPYPHMVLPGESLSGIALAEYDYLEAWHWIYAWNRAKIGDNPDIIHPFRELQLRKPQVDYRVWYVFHEVQKGESLWAIAELYFNDGRAWYRIYRDNRGIIESIGRIYPGQMLRIRRE